MIFFPIQVFSAALRWINHDITTRRRYVFEILNQVRLPLIPSKLLEKSINDCSDISLKVALRSIQKDLVSKRGSLVPLYVQPRICARKKIYVIGGSKRELISSWTRSECTFESVECFDTFRKEWQKVCPMEIGRILPGISVLNGRIYVVGGEQESQVCVLQSYPSFTFNPLLSLIPLYIKHSIHILPDVFLFILPIDSGQW